MSTKTESARRYHEQGYGCAKAIRASFAPDHGLSEQHALKLATGFGSGMGRLCEVCGALTGAFMVLGLKYGRAESDGTKYGPKTETTYALVHALASRFRERSGSIYCRELVGHDLDIPEEREKASQEGVFSTTCSKCVQDAVELMEESLEAESA
jgi:C_GCAxxG_C_C family probable redox protein